MTIIGYILLIIGPILCALTSRGMRKAGAKIAFLVIIAIGLIVIGGLRCNV